jgi:hypothetical protein
MWSASGSAFGISFLVENVNTVKENQFLSEISKETTHHLTVILKCYT